MCCLFPRVGWPLSLCSLSTSSAVLAWPRQSLSNTTRGPAGIAYRVPLVKCRSACLRQGIMSSGEGWNRRVDASMPGWACVLLLLWLFFSASYMSFLNLTTWSLSKQLKPNSSQPNNDNKEVQDGILTVDMGRYPPTFQRAGTFMVRGSGMEFL